VRGKRFSPLWRGEVFLYVFFERRKGKPLPGERRRNPKKGGT
jgi:hypothetical protein